MKRKHLLLFILALTVVLLISSCGEKPPQLFVVDFEENTTETSVQSLAIESGKTCSKPQDPTKEGYIFLGWYNGEELWNFDEDTVTSDIKLSAKWQRITFTVTFNSDGGSAIANQTINYGDIASKPQTPAKLDCEFLGWYKGDVLWNFNDNKVYENITLTAKWKNVALYTVTFDSDGGSAVDVQYVIHGNKPTQPTPPTKRGHRFNGWYLGETEWNFATDAVTENLTLKAKWEVTETYTVTFDSDGGSPVNTQYIVVGGKATEPTAPTKENHGFRGWFNGDVLWNFANDAVNTNITLVAKWENTTTYTVSFNTDGGSTVAPQYITHGGKASAPSIPTKENHQFLGWYNGSTKWNFDTNTVTDDITLTAKWKNVTLYTVSFDSDGGTEYPDQSVRHNNKAVSPGVPVKANSRFIGWYNGNDLWDFTTDNVTSNITLTAKYENAPTYTITFIPDSDDPTPIVLYVFIGDKIVAPQISKASYVLDGWYIEGTDTRWDFNVAPTKDITLVARWDFALPPHEF